MRRTLLRRAERYSYPGTLGTSFRIPITNCSYSGLCRPLVWTAFSVTPAIRQACRQSSSLESRSVLLPSNMARSSDNHSHVLRTCLVMRFPRVVAGLIPHKRPAGQKIGDRITLFAAAMEAASDGEEQTQTSPEDGP